LNADHQAARAEVLLRLEQQREDIDALLGQAEVAAERGGGRCAAWTPRSHTMRLLMSEPMFTAGLTALVAPILGPRAIQLLRALTTAFRAARGVGQQRNHGPELL
jgi:hypothetical protein